MQFSSMEIGILFICSLYYLQFSKMKGSAKKGNRLFRKSKIQTYLFKHIHFPKSHLQDKEKGWGKFCPLPRPWRTCIKCPPLNRVKVNVTQAWITRRELANVTLVSFQNLMIRGGSEFKKCTLSISLTFRGWGSKPIDALSWIHASLIQKTCHTTKVLTLISRGMGVY